jgi:threonine dehydratase
MVPYRLPEKEDILAAAERIKPYLHRTPVLTCRTLDEMTSASLFFKCENFQKAGAFKARGATNAVMSYSAEDLKQGVATHSSGNHAAALSMAAGFRGLPAHIVMPENSSRVKIEAVRHYGGNIRFCKPTLQAREETLREVVEATGALEIHPYNNYYIIAGQATAALELCNDYPQLDFVIAPVGGGGLLSGTALAMHYFSPETRVIAAEPSGADDACRSFHQNKLIPSLNPNTIADGLRTSLGTLTYPVIRDHVTDILTAGDPEIIAAMRLIWERMKIIVEPSSAVTLAVILANRQLFSGKRIGIILSGGNVDLGKWGIENLGI